MTDEERLFQVLDFILNEAGSGELRAVAEALKRRNAGSASGGLNPRSMAEGMAKKMSTRLGASLDIPEISRNIVTDLIRQKEPQISDSEIQVLLNRWLPRAGAGAATAGRAGAAATGAAEAAANTAGSSGQETGVPGPVEPDTLSPDMLILMVSQFLALKRGNLSVEEQKGLPDNWPDKYWKVFPDRLKTMIDDLLNERTEEVSFWTKMIGSLE